MPTGYTADVGDGTVTAFSTFAQRCARAFGALVLMRDEPMDAPIPEEFKPSSYHVEAVPEAEAEVDRLEAMGVAEIQEAARADHEQRHREWIERRERKTKTRERYEDMLAAAKDWTPPTPGHQGLKDFMIQQLEESIRFDCVDSRYDREPVSLDPELWHSERLQSARETLDRARQGLEEELARTADRNRWVRQLQESLS